MHLNELKINIKGLLFNSIILLMLINLILPGITGSWSKTDDALAYTYVFNYSTFTSRCLKIAFYLVYILLALSIHRHQKKGKIHLIIDLSILVFLIWCIISIFEANFQEIFLSDISINLSLIPLFYLLGYDKTVFNSSKKVIPYIVVIMIILILWNSISFILQYGVSVETRSSPSKEMFSVLISAYWCYALGMSDNRGNQKSLKYILGMFLLICAFLIRSRSWVIQCVLILYFIMALTSGKKSFLRKLLSLCILLLVFIVIIYLFPNITGALFNRIGEDTRSGQYEIFFSQVNPLSLILGNGINAGYNFLGNPNYKYFDNQYIYFMFHYGIIPIFCLVGVISDLFRKIKIGSLNRDEKAFINGCRLMSILFLAALGGLSVYYKIGWNVGTLLVFVFIGRAHKMVKESRKVAFKKQLYSNGNDNNKIMNVMRRKVNKLIS
ncbi:hypothetical protein L1999_24670 [Neobacillus drentensis]|uniref:hypothetical protein n=1 Tax=Neobacillus drentensis TaxID=220684 RepID=UPI001F2E7FDA|nr:hypothetical protein [Neobacillus drentensis]ULT56205.1 hypothetical protein L1999_24670 [Neobacillus drentensis]